jgi:hypothetical protein
MQVSPRSKLKACKTALRPVLLTLTACVLAIPAYAGPPFQTDDPVPVDLHHWETYLFGTFDHATGSTFAFLPGVEVNYGAAPNLQLHIIVPAAYVTPGPQYGIGDIELGVKYRFIQETKRHPQVGVFPLLEVPSGNGRLGLGNGQTWARLPVWVQKDLGPWTTYGGAGYQVNNAPGMKSSAFGGWLIQRDLNKRWTLGSEIYSQAAQAVGTRETTFWDGGGYYNFRRPDGLSFLFMSGHTIAGESHTVGYFALYYTWGPKSGGPPQPETGMMFQPRGSGLLSRP